MESGGTLRAAAFGIRAPITDDAESDVSSRSPRNGGTDEYYSGSDLDSDGSVTGDATSESAFEEEPVPDEEIVEEARVLEVHALSESSVSENGIVRIRVRKTGERVDDSDGNSEDHFSLKERRHRPVAHVADEEFPEASELKSDGAVAASLFKELRAPIARISCDTDSDSVGSEGFEEGGATPLLRVPSFAPKVRDWDADVESNESETESVERMNFDAENSSFPSVAEKIKLEPNLDSEEVQESDAIKGFGEDVDLDKQDTDSPDISSGTSFTETTDSGVEVGSKTEVKNPETIAEQSSDNTELMLISDGLMKDSCTVFEETRKEAPSFEQLYTSVEAEIDQINHDSMAGEESLIGCIYEVIDSSADIIESASFAVLEEIGESPSVHEAEDFFTNDPFASPRSMIMATRIIAEAMSTMDNSPKDHMASEVLNWLTIAEARSSFDASHFGSDNAGYIEPEAQGKHDSESPLSILVIGKTGVGKSATINSIFGENKTRVDAFEPGTKHVLELTGLISGVQLSIFDTPGLRNPLLDQPFNRKALSSIRKAVAKPDVVLYVDRLDMPANYLDDLILMRTITSYLGAEIWQKTVVVLTHAFSESTTKGPDGVSLSQDAFVDQRLRILRQLIICSSEEHEGPNFHHSVVPVCLVENHFSKAKGCCEMIPHWRSELLDFCYALSQKSDLHVQSYLSPVSPKKVRSESSEDLENMSSISCSYHREDAEHDDLHEFKPREPNLNARLDIRRFGMARHGCKFHHGFSVYKIPMINIYTALDEKRSSHFSVKIRHLDHLQLAVFAIASIANFTLSKILPQYKKDYSV